jgi:hypothetical protein
MRFDRATLTSLPLIIVALSLLGRKKDRQTSPRRSKSRLGSSYGQSLRRAKTGPDGPETRLPKCPAKQTFSASVGMSQRCQQPICRYLVAGHCWACLNPPPQSRIT